MISPICVDVKNGVITIMSKTFAKNAARFGTQEYATLQQVRSDNPTFTVDVRQIRKNASMEHYKGLTYDYMRWYIATHEVQEAREIKLAAFDEMIHISKCHSNGKRYSTIKSWFLEEYPDVKAFGKAKEENVEEQNVIELHADENLPRASGE